MAISLQALKNRLARLSWMPDASYLLTFNPQTIADGLKLFQGTVLAAILDVTVENDLQIKIRVPKLHPSDPHDQRHLLDSIARDLVKVISDIRPYAHLPLNELLTGRKVKRENFASDIIRTCLSPELITELSEWDMSITGALRTNLYGDIPVILFQLRHGDKIAAEITLDGWSNLILVNGFPHSFRMLESFSDAKDFRTTARREAYTYLEDITT